MGLKNMAAKVLSEAERDAKRARERAYYESHKDRRRASNRKYLAANGKKVAAQKQIYAASRVLPPETIAYRKAYSLAHPQENAAKSKAWRQRNPEQVRKAKRNRWIKKRKALISSLSVLQRGRCAYCRKPISGVPHVNHIIPKAAGGSNERSNLQLTCKRCNLSKNARDPIVFAQSMGMLL